jgi:hypothetical protein
VLWTAVRISHRVAGPTFNVGRVLERVRSGDLTARVHLRTHDYLVGLADHVNAHLDWLQAHPPVGVEAPDSAEVTKDAAEPETAAAEVAAGATTSDNA